ncbi:tumor necrosis factor receptor superfamily member 4-like [Gigantopelta aegis]|uniref:tumor necrosis factor receptor superfamily member 4-like n=1 Tax=Gigantopelta aegis TaxID=1735272 RepID=UPI001B88C3BE|nr:tumor necrosis factor receptor superfamily member 4-like [Gigantopelta aegis]
MGYAVIFIFVYTLCQCHVVTSAEHKAVESTKVYPTFLSNGTILFCYKCGPGSHVLEHCKQHLTNSKCLDCAEGYFQPSFTMDRRCQKCRRPCDGDSQRTTRRCSQTENTVCACKPGYGLTQRQGSEEIECVACRSGTFSKNQWCTPCTVCSQMRRAELSPCSATHDTECEKGYISPAPVQCSSATIVVLGLLVWFFNV